MTPNYSSENAQQWKSSVNSIWTNAVIIFICSTLPSVVTFLALIGDSLSSTQAATVTTAICGLVAYIAHWTLVSNLKKWEHSTSGQMKKYIGHYRRGIMIPLVCSIVVILFSMLSLFIAIRQMSLFEYMTRLEPIGIAFWIGIIIAGLVGIVCLLFGGIGLAFGRDIEKNVSSGAKFIVLSWGLNILVSIIIIMMTGEISVTSIDAARNAILFNAYVSTILSIVPPTVQLIGWRRIRNSELPTDAE